MLLAHAFQLAQSIIFVLAIQYGLEEYLVNINEKSSINFSQLVKDKNLNALILEHGTMCQSDDKRNVR